MTENRSSYSPESPDPPDRTADPGFTAGNRSPQPSSVREKDDDYRDVVAMLKPKLRVIRGSCGWQWVIQQQDAQLKGVPIWTGFAFCAAREGLLVRLRGHLLEEHLTELGYFKPKREKVSSARHGRQIVRDGVSKGALEETEATRARLKRGDVADFGVDPAAWAAIEALPDYFTA